MVLVIFRLKSTHPDCRKVVKTRPQNHWFKKK